MHAICEEMETRWPAELAGVRLQHFTVSYSPCLDCMRAEWRLPQAVRCHCNQEALEEVTFYTSPSLTFSKIGNMHRHTDVDNYILAINCVFYLQELSSTSP